MIQQMVHRPVSPFPLRRDDALRRLRAFAPHAGRDYARLRNIDHGPGRHTAVSGLSAALRRRVISEEEVIAAVLDHHDLDTAQSFISEVFWRTYWKGWLEQRPGVWHRYLADCAAARGTLEGSAWQSLYHRACGGGTGIDGFDQWVAELRATGYLHNWARMQLASIWVFTLRLPWVLGAAFTLAHFVDGDPASNTLSWRWVAGLHTPGRAYLADAERIAAMTQGRFHPQGLAREILVPRDGNMSPVMPLRSPRAFDPALPSALLLTPEDLSLETLPSLGQAFFALVIAPQSLFPGEADLIAGQDALDRAGAHWGCPAIWVPDLPQAAEAARGLPQMVTGFATVGPVRAALVGWAADLAGQGISLAEWRRAWDETCWPHCHRGFFALRKQIPTLVASRLDRAKGQEGMRG